MRRKTYARLGTPDRNPLRQIVRVVDLPKGSRPFRVHIDPMGDGAEAVNAVGDRVRAEFYERIGFADLLGPGKEG